MGNLNTIFRSFLSLLLSACLLLLLTRSVVAQQDNNSSNNSNSTLLNNFESCINNQLLARNLSQFAIVTSQSANYSTAIISFNYRTVFQNLAIVYPFNEGQLQVLIQCGKQLNMTLAPRGGGHGYEGFPQQVIVDMSSFSDIQIDSVKGIATVGAGAR